MALLIESPLKLAWRSKRYKPLFTSDSISVAAIAIAERFARVLIVSPVKPTLAMASSISHKPNAIRWEECIERKTNLVSVVSEFCRFRQSPLARAKRVRLPRPFVIVHDINYYLGDEVTGRLQASSRAEAEDTVLQIEQILRGYGGEGIVAVSRNSTDEGHSEWIRDTGWKTIDPYAAGLVVDQQPLTKKSWIHSPHVRRPAEYGSGPLEGTKTEVASWMSHDGKSDYRRLKTPAQNGTIWVTQSGRYRIAVYFREQRKFAEANLRRLEAMSRAITPSSTDTR